MRERAAWLSLLGAVLLLAAPALGEDVYLKNGRVFRGVIAQTEGAMVRIQMPGGDLSLPMSTVLRVETSGASYRDYLARRNVLLKSGGTAAEWLDLARWARSAGMDSAAREAGLMAARFDPRAPGLQALLGEVGFVLDPGTGGYIPFEDAQARQGLVFYDGAWISSAEREARTAEYRQERGRLAAAAAREELLLEAQAQAQAEAQAQEEADAATGIPLEFAYGGSGYLPYGGAVGNHRMSHGGSFPPGAGIPWRPQRPPCTSCAPAPQPQRAPAHSPGRRQDGTLKPLEVVPGATAPRH